MTARLDSCPRAPTSSHSLPHERLGPEELAQLGVERRARLDPVLRPETHDRVVALAGESKMDAVRELGADHVLPRDVTDLAGALRQAIGRDEVEVVADVVGGDIFHGALHLDQIYAMRPAAGFADYRTPVPGLYVCGSGAHPGSGVSGNPGRNAAREMIRDFRRRRVGR